MNVREEVENMKKEVQDLEQQSLAMELVKDYKKSNKRWYIICILLIIYAASMTIYLIYTLKDIGIEKDIVTQENEKGYNNYIGRDGSVANGETNNYYH